MEYSKKIKEFAKVRMAQTPNNTQIARDIVNKFNLGIELDIIRRRVSYWRKRENIKAKQLPIKRLFFDIETTYMIYRRWKHGKDKYVNPQMIIKDSEIICISYKWQYENEVHSLDWRMGEKEMLRAFINILGEADEIIAHNGNRFDIKEIRTRCIYHGILMFPIYRTLDTLVKSKRYFNFSSNKLDYIGRFLNIGGKRQNSGIDLWIKVTEHNDEDALEEMIKYCERDVIILEDSYYVMSPFITHNNNFAVLTGGEKWMCPECGSDNVEMNNTYTTSMGIIRRNMKCDNCKKQYKISNKNYMDYLQQTYSKQ